MQKENFGDKDILTTIDRSITQLDEQRLTELTNLKKFQEIKNEVFKLERKRLAAKYGEDHPRVKEAGRRLAYNQEMFYSLDKEIEKARIKTEPLPNNAWRLHGKVFDQKNAPVNGVTVFFSDEKKNWIRQLGNDCTDETGHYSITIVERLIVSIENRPLYLSVSDKKQQLIYHDKDPLHAVKGLIDYRDVHLNGKDCVPPSTRNDNEKDDPNAAPQ